MTYSHLTGWFLSWFLLPTSCQFRCLSDGQQSPGQCLDVLPVLIQVHLRLPQHVHQHGVAHLIQHHLHRQLGAQSGREGSREEDETESAGRGGGEAHREAPVRIRSRGNVDRNADGAPPQGPAPQLGWSQFSADL